MFKLILLFILFVVFLINYFFGFIYTMPYFKFITKFNFYEYLLDKFESRNGYFTGLEITQVKKGNKTYLVDFTGGILITDLKYFSPDSDKLSIYIPIFILHTGSNITSSGDKLFNGLDFKKDFKGYYQYITGGENYIPVGEEYRDRKKYKLNIYLGYLYSYCYMTGTKWVDAYLYDRYLQWNKPRNYSKINEKVDGYYVCENDRTEKACPDGYSEYNNELCYRFIPPFFIDYKNKVSSCFCDNKGEYFICKDENNLNCDTGDTAGYNACIDYHTGVVDLNSTNCSYSGALGIGQKSKYFLIR